MAELKRRLIQGPRTADATTTLDRRKHNQLRRAPREHGGDGEGQFAGGIGRLPVSQRECQLGRLDASPAGFVDGGIEGRPDCGRCG